MVRLKDVCNRIRVISFHFVAAFARRTSTCSPREAATSWRWDSSNITSDNRDVGDITVVKVPSPLCRGG